MKMWPVWIFYSYGKPYEPAAATTVSYLAGKHCCLCCKIIIVHSSRKKWYDFILFDVITFLSQCNTLEIRATFPLWKWAAIVRRHQASFSCVQCFRVSIPPDARHTLLRQMDMGSLTCAQIWVRAVHTKGGQGQTSLHKSWLGGTDKLFLTLPRQGIEPRVFGVKSRLSNHWATSPVYFIIGVRITNHVKEFKADSLSLSQTTTGWRKAQFLERRIRDPKFGGSEVRTPPMPGAQKNVWVFPSLFVSLLNV